MPTVSTRVVNHAGEAWSHVLVDWAAYIGTTTGEFVFGLNLSSWTGRRTIETNYIVGDEEIENVYVLSDKGATEYYAPWELPVLPGWSRDGLPIPADLGEDGGYEFWKAYLQAKKRIIGLGLTGTTLFGEIEASWDPGLGGATCNAVVWVGTNAEGCYTDRASVTITSTDPDIANDISGAIGMPASADAAQANLAAGTELQLKRVADALDKLANADLDVSLNNGAVVVSVRSGSLIT